MRWARFVLPLVALLTLFASGCCWNRSLVPDCGPHFDQPTVFESGSCETPCC